MHHKSALSGKRQYDPALGRFTSIDPITHHQFTPYQAFDNHPVYWVDPSGADSYRYDWDSNDGTYINNTTGENTKDWQTAINETNEEFGIDSKPLSKKVLGSLLGTTDDGEIGDKFDALFGVNISPYGEISEQDLKQINAVMQNVIDNDYSKIAKYEIPILIFVGERFKNKYGSEWKLSNASNDFGNGFVIPYIEVNGKDLELGRKIYRYLNHPNLEYGYEKFRFSHFLDLDFIITQSFIEPKKQG